MDNFIVSARKYRPETFLSVVGQTSITTTLKSAIKNNHLGHSYLFCGPRGVGKTTCARIFAKTINCSHPVEGVEPCNKCESCLSFNESRSYNIHELDAASNNSVEDIRSLTEQVRIPPQIGKYSVYIIDEVHMLSLSAFNAFLKTLEEPPAHAVFILATTEKHKIIPTILSRCQIFDFNRIKVDDAVKYLEFICHEEKIKYDYEALHVIAQKADGAMRDALSIFDQVVSFSGSEIKYQTVIDNLNILDFEYYFKIVDYLLNGDISYCLLKFDEILDNGFDAHNFINGLASHLRDLLVSKNPETVKLLEVSENLRIRFLEQSQKCPVDFLFSSLEICNDADIHYKSSRNQRLLIELSLLKMTGIAGLKKKSLTENLNEDPLTEKIIPAIEVKRNEPKQAVAISDYSEKTGRKKESISDKVILEDKHAKKNIIAEKNISIRNLISGNPVNPTISENSEPESDLEGFEDPEAVYENDFTQEELHLKWKTFADQLQYERPRIAVSLKSKEPKLEQGYKIEITFENEHLREDFDNSVKASLLTYLRKELFNNSIILKIVVEGHEGNGKKMIYTPKEKFMYLVRKNPALEKLKQQFNLELE
jgi:DNA polymerase III subunit gamma/tau